MTCLSAVLDKLYSLIGIEPHLHPTLLASFGEDTAETEEDSQHSHVVRGVGTLFSVIQVALEPLIVCY